MMKIKMIILTYLIIFLFNNYINCNVNLYDNVNNLLKEKTSNSHAKWAVVGAGVAGISVVAILHDCHVPFNEITWIDPEFNVGRLGQYYQNVPSNSKVKEFFCFINICKTFQQLPCPGLEKLKTLDPESEQLLKVMVEPLQQISNELKNRVTSLQDSLENLYFENNLWHISTKKTDFTADNVILATGSHPKVLQYGNSNIIPLDIAIDFNKLRNIVLPNDSVLVVGSSHSAILILKYLSELNVKAIFNLYNKPIHYYTEINNNILYPATGLKGIAAQWAKEVLEKNPPKNLFRIFNSEENRKKTIDGSTKIIYAVGFERNQLPPISQNPNYNYNDTNGIIAPRLFGIGIAFPEKMLDALGNTEYKVGMNSFITYAQRIVPYWLNIKIDRSKLEQEINKHIGYLNSFDSLFEINLL